MMSCQVTMVVASCLLALPSTKNLQKMVHNNHLTNKQRHNSSTNKQLPILPILVKMMIKSHHSSQIQLRKMQESNLKTIPQHRPLQVLHPNSQIQNKKKVVPLRRNEMIPRRETHVDNLPSQRKHLYKLKSWCRQRGVIPTQWQPTKIRPTLHSPKLRAVQHLQRHLPMPILREQILILVRLSSCQIESDLHSTQFWIVFFH
mmetsp:Transcript_10528/g.15815  ORF Transcript_10528/g.15815 Transcript_10528/m.15815 type:complete len:202 (+) Transcript_10528:989-1594(+)